jgi:Arrestin (or S-antigen), N-terminal domain
MIFKKILKGTDLTFDMSLEKTQYRPGERVRGTLNIKTEKASKARQLILFAEGKEATIITVSESTGAASSSLGTTTRTYRETNTFFSKDLSHLLQESVSCNIVQDGTLEILPQNKVIPFDFTLPDDNNLFSSYKGKHASITYTVKGTADITKKLDVNKEEQFSVIKYNNKMVTYSNNSSFGGENENDTINTTTGIENQNNISPSPIIEGEEKNADKENYEARFEQIFGKQANRTSPQNRPRRYFTFSGTSMNFDLGTIFAKGREHFLKESSEAKIDLLDHKNNNVPYSPGHTVKGEVILLLPSNEEQEEMRRKIRGMKITLSGVENAFAQGLQRVSTIEKYEKNIELNGEENRGNEDDNNDNTIPFEFEIPQGVKPSYIGKYSEYFWGIETKLNITWSSDINARTIIEVV